MRKLLNADKVKIDVNKENTDNTSTTEKFTPKIVDTSKYDKSIAKRIDAIFVGDDEYIANVLPLDLYSYIITIVKEMNYKMPDVSYDIDGNFDIVKDQIKKLIDKRPGDGYPYTITIRTALMCILDIKYLDYGILPQKSKLYDAIDEYLNYVVAKLQIRV